MDHIQPIVTLCSVVFSILEVYGALYFVFQKSDKRWAALKKKSDERFQKSDDR